MKSKAKHNNDCECFFEVEIPVEEVNQALEEVYREIKKHAKIPGFRPGAAPQDLLEKYHGEHANDEALKRLIPSGYRQALLDQKIDAVGLPEISDVVFEKNKNLSFKAKVEIRPAIKLKKYKGIKVKKEKISVSDQEIDDTVKRLQEIHARFEPIKEKRPVKQGDHAICDIEAFIDGKPISKKHENMWVEANKDASMLGMGEKLVGLNMGEVKEIDVELPDTYPDKKFAGKKALFKVHIKEIKEKIVPVLDNEFAKDLGKETLETVKEEVKEQLLEKKEANNKINMKNQILSKLLSEYDITVPPSMVKRQFEVLSKQLEEELLQRGMHKDSIDEKKKELDAELKGNAVNKVKLYFILDTISEKEDIKVEQSDLDARIEEIARLSNQPANTVRQYYEQNKLIPGLWEQIKEEKTIDMLLVESEVTE